MNINWELIIDKGYDDDELDYIAEKIRNREFFGTITIIEENKMLTENEIRNHLEIGKTLHEQGKWDNNLPEDRPDRLKVLEEKWEVLGYISALRYVLGEEKPKWSKEDIA